MRTVNGITTRFTFLLKCPNDCIFHAGLSLGQCSGVVTSVGLYLKHSGDYQ